MDDVYDLLEPTPRRMLQVKLFDTHPRVHRFFVKPKSFMLARNRCLYDVTLPCVLVAFHCLA